MTHIIKGWTLGLIYGSERYFLGVHKTAEGVKHGCLCKTPVEKKVYNYLFETPEKATAFWKVFFEELVGNERFIAVPLKVEISVSVAGLGFEWNGLPSPQ